ncbi:MAG: efflux transporter outer membrane subunit [Deltaproteobacteria bacterium]|jgi:Cu(I)/Ag(I) efflux system outer membrane protein|nr:efflux transporter outer membrane subunit [Deltaproteobacteria bacterium]
MTRSLFLRFVLVALLAPLLSACSLAPDYLRPELPVPAAIVETGTAEQAPRLADWREFFKDPRLREFISASLERNRDLRLAVLAVAEARARYGVQNAERFPMLDAQGSGAYSGKFQPPSENRNYESAAMATFAPDLFGRLGNMSEAALQAYLATKEAAKAAQIVLVSEVAREYLAERLAAEGRQLALDALKSRRDSYAFVERRVQSGQSSLLDLEQARSMVAAASAVLAQREREVIQADNALQFFSGGFKLRDLPPAVPLVEQRLADLPLNVSSLVLLERPEIMEAEHKLRAANADIGAARAAFFPSISLTGNLGYMSADLSQLVAGASGFWSFLPRITLPIFAGGRNAANLELAEIRKESSIVQYEKSIQSAFREVADALRGRKFFAEQYAAQRDYLASQRLVLDLAMSRYVNGSVSYLEVLDAQRNVFQSELDLLGIRRDQLLNEISLYSALGGGLAAFGRSAQAARGF